MVLSSRSKDKQKFPSGLHQSYQVSYSISSANGSHDAHLIIGSSLMWPHAYNRWSHTVCVNPLCTHTHMLLSRNYDTILSGISQ